MTHVTGRAAVFAIVALAGCAGFLSLSTAPAQTAPARPTPPPGEFAAPATCAVCHKAIWETYRKTGMGRSFYRPTVDTPEGSYYHKLSDTHFTVLRRDGRLSQRRHQLDGAGREINVVEKSIDFILGSGNHARTYLHRTARNTLIELPLGWYAEKGGYLAMNPGYDRPDHEDFRRKIGYDCMYCHNGYPKIPPGNEQPFAEPVYSGALPEGIDCQRCHGPGAQHARLAQTAGAKADDIRRAIVNPAHLSAERRQEVCMQCHLETTSFPLPNALQRYDRGPFAYKPGEPLSNYWLFFDHAPNAGRGGKFEIVNAVYRMRQSKCFLESKGALECTSCHNPHDAPRGEAATRHYDAACRKCHTAGFDQLVAAGKHPSASGCAVCHMPKRRTEDVVHAVATDHLVQRRPPAGDLLAELAERHEEGDKAYRGEVVPYYPAQLAATSDNELYAALAQVIDRSNLAVGIPRLEKAIAANPNTRAEFYTALADAFESSGQPAKAIEWYQAALKKSPRSVFTRKKLAAALRRAGQNAEALAVLRAAAGSTPNDASIWNELGLVYRQQGLIAQATAALTRALSVDPELAEAHSNLGALRASNGDAERAEADFREAIRLQPGYADAHNNLGNLLASRNDLEQARVHQEAAVRLRPNDAPTRYNFALTLGRLRRYDDAMQQLQDAVAADPDFGDARLLLAQLLIAKGQTQDALPHLQKAAAASDPAIRERAAEVLRQIRSGQ